MGDIQIGLGAAQRLCDEHTSEDGTDDAADTVHAEHVGGVIHLQQALETGHTPHADHAGEETDHDRAKRTDRTAGRGDANQAGHRTRGGTQCRRLALADGFHQRPAQHGSGGGQHGVEEGQRGHGIGRGSGAGIEAEPAHPQQHRADIGERHVVRLQRGLAVAQALANEPCGDQAGHVGHVDEQSITCE
ncbi:hypothetical protein G6F46_013908 [Rhizopus delemar]|nr:hypothetical protein G6F46_013908 [Rhizopus delemar]